MESTLKDKKERKSINNDKQLMKGIQRKIQQSVPSHDRKGPHVLLHSAALNDGIQMSRLAGNVSTHEVDQKFSSNFIPVYVLHLHVLI